MNLEKFRNKNHLNRSSNGEDIKSLPGRDFENRKKKDSGIFQNPNFCRLRNMDEFLDSGGTENISGLLMSRGLRWWLLFMSTVLNRLPVSRRFMEIVMFLWLGKWRNSYSWYGCVEHEFR